MNTNYITLSDIASLDFLAEEALHEMRFNGASYDDGGNWIPLENKSAKARFYEYQKNLETNILEFTKHPAIRELTLENLVGMSLEEIQAKYLSEILPKACGVIRSMASYTVCAELSPEITDSYLQDLFTIRWRDNAMMWIARWKAETSIVASLSPISLDCKNKANC